MYSGKICYRGEVKEKTGGVYSCDKIQLVFRLRHETSQGLLDALAAVQWFEFDHWESRKFGTYRNQFRIVCGDKGERSFWLGVGWWPTEKPAERLRKVRV